MLSYYNPLQRIISLKIYSCPNDIQIASLGSLRTVLWIRVARFLLMTNYFLEILQWLKKTFYTKDESFFSDTLVVNWNCNGWCHKVIAIQDAEW